MSVFKSFSLMSILTFLSRILGYARDLLFAFIFGASSSADSFLLAFRLPNLFRRIFAEGAISTALIPLYFDIKKKSSQLKLLFVHARQNLLWIKIKRDYLIVKKMNILLEL